MFQLSTQALAQTTEAYNWNNLAIGGGGFVSAIIPSKSQANLFYARTDVGGAYRWDASTSKWIPLLDWVSDNEVGYLGVESLALDPNAPNKVYMLAGISYFNNGKTAILRSDDYGNTFTITDVTNQFKAHGNGMGRQNGERLQVDPNNGNILYCGTRWNGLFKSTNGGASWSAVTSLSNVTTTPNENGISIVALDSSSVLNGATQRIFVGVSKIGANFYRSDDGGNTFTPVLGGPAHLMPQRAIIEGGDVYITYANGAGPHGHWSLPEPMDQGQFWRYNIATGIWTNLTPLGFTNALSGVSIDPNNPLRIVISSINTYWQQGNAWGDQIFLTSNGGASWTNVVSRGFTLDPNGITWIEGNSIHWAGSIEFDPFNTQRVLVTSGNGVFVNEDIDATQGIWKFNVKGLEETVPLGLESIPGGPILSVIGDYDGFRHTDPTMYAPIHTPRMGTTTGLAYAAGNPGKVLRVGNSMYYSTDTAKSWTQCSINGSKGQVAVSADGNVFLHCPDGSSILYRSTDNGSSWTVASGISTISSRPVADPVNASKFYAYDPATGDLFVSTNGGTSFTISGKTLSGGSKVIRAIPGIEGDIWVPLYNGGLARSSNSGQSLSLVSGVSYCGAVGFGKAAPGNTFPSVYIWGTVNNVRGIHRSDDQGLTWVRVNDDAHEYGGPANGQFVQGDMNVYGRVFMSTAGRGVVYGDITPTLNVHPSSLTFSEGAGNQNLTISSNVNWNASSNATWLTVSPSSGANNGVVTVTASANTGTSRLGTITITGGGITRTIPVSQAASSGSNTIVVRARGVVGGEIIELRLDNVTVATWTLTKKMTNYSTTGTGQPSVHFINDEKRKDVQVDYLMIGSTTYQAEEQAINTGVLVNNQCGGSYSEWLNCNGYISFTSASTQSLAAIQASTNSTVEMEENNISVGPNPTDSKVTIRFSKVEKGTMVTLFSSTGQAYRREFPQTNVHVMDITSLPSGFYIIQVLDGKRSKVFKVLKR